MEVKINIDDFLTESEKKQCAIEAFKEQIKNTMFKGNRSDIVQDSEIQRIVGNISHSIVAEEIGKYIPNYEELIIRKTKEAIEKDSYSYFIFKRKDAWEKESGLGYDIARKAIEDNKNIIQEGIKKAIEDHDYSSELSEKISEEFEELASKFYSLSELFLNKK